MSEYIQLTNTLFPQDFRNHVNATVKSISDTYKNDSLSTYPKLLKALKEEENIALKYEKQSEKDPMRYDIKELKSIGYKNTLEVQRTIHTVFAVAWTADICLGVLNDNIKFLNDLSPDAITDDLSLNNIISRTNIMIDIILKIIERSDNTYDSWVSSLPDYGHKLFLIDHNVNIKS